MADPKPATRVPAFPGSVIKRNSPLTAAVAAIQTRLNNLGIAQLPETGLFDAATESAVKRFQGLFTDLNGLPLTIDGEVGELSWGALFGAASLPAIGAGGRLAEAALAVAVAELGVMEEPLGSNSGKRVNEYLASTGTAPGNFWCAAFVFFCAKEGAAKAGIGNPLPRTAGVNEMWRKAKAAGLPQVTAEQAQAQPALVTAGMIFSLDFGGGAGHTGYVRARDGGRLVTVEGNSNNDGSRNGTGVFELKRRTLGTPGLLGFIGLP